MVECPVGGSTAPARQGKLLGLMGAEPADAERAKPILNQLCRRLEHCGPVGTGASMKLAINLPLMVAWQAYGEAFAIARSAGWEPKRLLDLFVDTNGANPAHEKPRRDDRDDVRGARSGPDHVQHRQWREGSAHDGRNRRSQTAPICALPKPRLPASRTRPKTASAAAMDRACRSIGPAAKNPEGVHLMTVTLAQASSIVDCHAEEGARTQTNAADRGGARFTGGHLVCAKREDGSGIIRFEVAVGKAYGALGMGWGSRTMMERAAQNPNFLTAIVSASGGRLVPNPGWCFDPRRRQSASSVRSAFPATPAITTRSSQSPELKRRDLKPIRAAQEVIRRYAEKSGRQS